MPSQKNLEDRLDICCENIRSRISIMEAYAKEAHAVDVKGLMSLAVNLSTVNINEQIILCDNTIRIIGELKHLLKEEERRRNLNIQLEDSEQANKTKEMIKSQISEARRQKRFNPYQVEHPTSSSTSPPSRREVSRSSKQIN